jgi:electron transfer flavoprotein beta subunit
MRFVVCWKWVVAGPDERWAHVSPADEAALEIALALAGPGDEVVMVSLAPESAEEILRVGLAAGANRVIRLDAPTGLASSDVATALATAIERNAGGADLVLCGDYSLDRGSGSVPAFLAGELGAAQALGLVEVEMTERSATRMVVRGLRRLDGGRREVLDVPVPAVLSVEGSVASLRRAPLAASLASKDAAIEVVPGPAIDPLDPLVLPDRPRPRVVPAPVGSTLTRVRDLLAIGGDDETRAEIVTLDPPAAARRILDQLREWGHVT